MADFKSTLTVNGSAVLTALTGYTQTQLSTSGAGAAVHFNNLTNKPTTLSGYGITDAPTKAGVGATGTWGISITGDSSTVDGLSLATGSAAPGANKIIRSQVSGYTFFNYMHSDTANGENPIVGQVIVTNGTDGFYRKATIAHLTSAVQANAAGTWGINIIGNAVTTSQTTFSEVYSNGWFRNINQQGLFNSTYTMYLYGSSTSSFTIATQSAAYYPYLTFRSGFGGTTRGSVYSDSSGFGMLHSGGGWMFYANGSDAVWFPGTILVQQYVAVTQNSVAGYQFYERDQNQLWVLYAASNIARLWRGSDLFQFSSTGSLGVRHATNASVAMLVQGFGTTSASYSIAGYDNTGASTFWVRDDGAGYIKAGAWTYSDRRNKRDIVRIYDGLSLVNELRPCSYVFVDDTRKRTRFGFVAQDVELVAPELVDYSVHPGSDDPQYSLDYTGIIAPLVSAVQELSRRISILETTHHV
jgi:hypothetical protein